ncbi:MAG: hypothetical protein [Cressdnaviricota sp.]|nr:MAG: hypothetical protein [Cressdnaviricota sp.]
MRKLKGFQLKTKKLKVISILPRSSRSFGVLCSNNLVEQRRQRPSQQPHPKQKISIFCIQTAELARSWLELIIFSITIWQTRKRIIHF